MSSAAALMPFWALALVFLLPVGTALIGGFWALVTYLNQRRDLEQQNLVEAERRGQTRLIEAQRPFLEKQLALYFETAQIVGKLVTLDRGAEWDSVERRFWALYWSELSMVETRNVESAMEGFGRQLNQFKAQPNGGSVGSLQEAGYHLAHAIRDSIKNDWGAGNLAARPGS